MKRNTLSLCLALLSYVVMAQTPCENGMAGSYPCNDYDLLAHFDLNDMNANAGNDSWGWTDPQDGNEYAIIGLDNGTAFFDIADPINPVYLGKLPTHTTSSTWRDIKVYNDYAFIVSEAGGHGMQVFDLTRLRNVPNAPETFTEDAHYDGFGNAHNIVINPDLGFAYAVGTTTYSGGPHVVNIQNPTNPVEAGGYADSFYTHDAQVVTYDGPDTAYTGQQIMIGSNEDAVVVVGLTDSDNPVLISSVMYSDIGYTHQGWLTEDHQYFLLGDEIDEINFGFNSRTVVFDLTDLDNPSVKFEYSGPTSAIDHNGYVKGDEFFIANYTAGMRVVDVSDIANNNMVEVGFFDSFPATNGVGFSGAWNVYPYFDSGNIIISDIDGGFFLVRKSGTLDLDKKKKLDLTLYPNPVKENLYFKSSSKINKIEVFDMLGKKVLTASNSELLGKRVNTSQLNAGIYVVRFNETESRKIIVQ